MKHVIFSILCIAVIVAACATSEKAMKEEPMMKEESMAMEEMPFGGDDDVAYANMLWEKREMGGFNSMPATPQPGKSPHGAITEILEGKIDRRER